MGLIVCSDCKREISDQAASCPQCGRPRGTTTGPATSIAAPPAKVVADSTVESGVKLGFGMFCLLPLLIVLIPLAACAVVGVLGGGVAILANAPAAIVNAFSDYPILWLIVPALAIVALVSYYLKQNK